MGTRRLFALFLGLFALGFALLALGAEERPRTLERETFGARIAVSIPASLGKLIRPEAPAWSSASQVPARRATEPPALAYLPGALRQTVDLSAGSPLILSARAPCIAWRRHIPRMDSEEPPGAFAPVS